jgi:starch phosphorylase
MSIEYKVAYFSMEIGLESGIPTYSGGLGVLAGDTIRSAANLRVPMVAVTLLHRKGYFYQKLDSSGWQTEEAVAWDVDDFLTELPGRATVTIEGRTVALRAWKYDVSGYGGHVVPVLFIDSDLPENGEQDRRLTDHLYGGDDRYRLCQEVILGIGGVRMLRALGFKTIERFHLNEGHAALLTVELAREHLEKNSKDSVDPETLQSVRRKCVFTTHTPVTSGHDQFSLDLVRKVLGEQQLLTRREIFCCENRLNMTYIALNMSHYINGVAKRHQEISSLMFADYTIDSITNGVNAATWASDSFQRLFDQYIPGWREDNFSLRYALNIPGEALWKAHIESKRKLLQFVNRETNTGLDADVLTIGFARRASTYKRADLIFHDIKRLSTLSRDTGRIQLIFAGKAHPVDEGGKELIKRIFRAKETLEKDIRVAYLTNYDMDIGKLMTAGVDVWLNNPIPPREASGTSGMKAAMNGVPSLSILDGWWIEGCIEGLTGWSFGQAVRDTRTSNDEEDASSLYETLERRVLPIFYEKRDEFINIMTHVIALNGSFFNTQRMMQQYVLKAYFE